MIKKIFLILSLIILSISRVDASLIEVELLKCIDGDTAKFIVNKKEETIRFLAIDTPEDTTKKEPFGQEASLFTCDHLKQAKKITIELDSNSDKYDRYNRLLAWVFIDGTLLQTQLVKEGLAKVAYLYGDYKYTDKLKVAEKKAKAQGLNIWAESKPSNLRTIIYITITIISIGFIFIKYNNELKKD